MHCVQNTLTTYIFYIRGVIEKSLKGRDKSYTEGVLLEKAETLLAAIEEQPDAETVFFKHDEKAIDVVVNIMEYTDFFQEAALLNNRTAFLLFHRMKYVARAIDAIYGDGDKLTLRETKATPQSRLGLVTHDFNARIRPALNEAYSRWDENYRYGSIDVAAVYNCADSAVA